MIQSHQSVSLSTAPSSSCGGTILQIGLAEGRSCWDERLYYSYALKAQSYPMNADELRDKLRYGLVLCLADVHANCLHMIRGTDLPAQSPSSERIVALLPFHVLTPHSNHR